MIAAGLAMIAIGLFRSGGESEGSQELTAPAETAAQTEAAATPAPEAPPAQGGSLKRREVDGRYAIGVPRGWDADSGDQVLSLIPRGRAAEIRIYYATGAEPDLELAEGARGFLADEHQGAQVGRPQRIRVGSTRGFQVTATYGGGGGEIAMVLTRGGFSFLVLRRVDKGASEAIAAQADASFRSFRAKR